ncbi:hypothetical protein ACFVWR_09600 [Leifsonia sp. NPDC058292]|uniref:hypothetical protein n=1 Tax=Leifsonia sp. NPDC058292 TaxID=3346428 RepID=UPI0036DA9AB9
MNGDVMGGGVVVAIAAALWLAYLIPVWSRRREYIATERNAVRLQQTLRILAETSEMPEEVRLEASARAVAEQQRILKRAEQRTMAEARAAAAARARREHAVAEAERLAAEEAERTALQAIAVERAARAAAAQRASVLAAATVGPALSPQRRRRLRRARALSSVVLTVALVGVFGGLAAVIVSGAWLLLAASTVVGAAAIGMLGRLARPQQAETVGRAQRIAPAAPALYDDAQHEVRVEARAPRQTWTPQPLPKPLHLSRGTIAASAMASIDAATELRRAAARAEIDRKAAEFAPDGSPSVTLAPLAPIAPVAPLRPAAAVAPQVPVAPVATASNRYAAMGVVDGLSDGAIDLDAVLRRRRAAS